MKRERLEDHPRPSCHGPRFRFGPFFDDEGQDLIEYGLLAAIISVGSVGVLKAVAAGITPLLETVLAALRSL